MTSAAIDISTLPLESRVSELYQRVPWEFGEGPDGFMGGWWSLRLIGEVVTELAARLDGDTSLIRRYEEVDFTAPVYSGDYVRFRGELVRVGNTSRTIDFYGDKLIAQAPTGWPGADELNPPLRFLSGRVIIVIPKLRQRGPLGRDTR
jgi:3-aminobutyryl-CoA ammonia-lyase